jgi:hypothetical protein
MTTDSQFEDRFSAPPGNDTNSFGGNDNFMFPDNSPIRIPTAFRTAPSPIAKTSDREPPRKRKEI